MGGSLLWARSFYDEPPAGAVAGGKRPSHAGTGFGPRQVQARVVAASAVYSLAFLDVQRSIFQALFDALPMDDHILV